MVGYIFPGNQVIRRFNTFQLVMMFTVLSLQHMTTYQVFFPLFLKVPKSQDFCRFPEFHCQFGVIESCQSAQHKKVPATPSIWKLPLDNVLRILLTDFLFIDSSQTPAILQDVSPQFHNSPSRYLFYLPGEASKFLLPYVSGCFW